MEPTWSRWQVHRRHLVTSPRLPPPQHLACCRVNVMCNMLVPLPSTIDASCLVKQNVYRLQVSESSPPKMWSLCFAATSAKPPKNWHVSTWGHCMTPDIHIPQRFSRIWTHLTSMKEAFSLAEKAQLAKPDALAIHPRLVIRMPGEKTAEAEAFMPSWRKKTRSWNSNELCDYWKMLLLGAHSVPFSLLPRCTADHFRARFSFVFTSTWAGLLKPGYNATVRKLAWTCWTWYTPKGKDWKSTQVQECRLSKCLSS